MPSISKITFNGNTLIDLTGDTVTAENLLYSVKAHMANGNIVTGQYTGDEPIVINVPMYDVGDIFVTTRNGDPATLLGYGTWSQIKDKFLLAAGDTYTAGSTGGEASVTLTINEMPEHTHNDDLTNVTSTVTDGYPMIGGYTVARSNAAVGGSAGGGQAHNNMPPYLVVYTWLRTA